MLKAHMADEDHQSDGWIDYLITSDDPVDKALLAEFRDRSWAHGQLMQFITADPTNIDTETFARMEEEHQGSALRRRIPARGLELRDAGYALTDETAFKAGAQHGCAWRAYARLPVRATPDWSRSGMRLATRHAPEPDMLAGFISC